MSRPLKPEVTREWVQKYETGYWNYLEDNPGGGLSDGQKGAVRKYLVEAEKLEDNRHLAYGWLFTEPGQPFGPKTTKEFTESQWYALKRWIGAEADEMGNWAPHPQWKQEYTWVIWQAKIDAALFLNKDPEGVALEKAAGEAEFLQDLLSIEEQTEDIKAAIDLIEAGREHIIHAFEVPAELINPPVGPGLSPAEKAMLQLPEDPEPDPEETMLEAALNLGGRIIEIEEDPDQDEGYVFPGSEAGLWKPAEPEPAPVIPAATAPVPAVPAAKPRFVRKSAGFVCD